MFTQQSCGNTPRRMFVVITQKLNLEERRKKECPWLRNQATDPRAGPGARREATDMGKCPSGRPFQDEQAIWGVRSGGRTDVHKHRKKASIWVRKSCYLEGK